MNNTILYSSQQSLHQIYITHLTILEVYNQKIMNNLFLNLLAVGDYICNLHCILRQYYYTYSAQEMLYVILTDKTHSDQVYVHDS